MKTNIIPIFVLLLLSSNMAVSGNMISSIGEAERVRTEMHENICDALTHLFAKNLDNPCMQNLNATIYYEVLQDQSVHFSYIDCGNADVSALILKYLNDKKYIANELLIGEKYRFKVKFKYYTYK